MRCPKVGNIKDGRKIFRVEQRLSGWVAYGRDGNGLWMLTKYGWQWNSI